MCVPKEEEDTSVFSKLQRIPVITAMLCTLVLLLLYLPLLNSAPVYRTPHNQTTTRHWFKSGEDSVKWYSQQWINQLYATTSELFTL
ncbi:unnamed protein product, partial [Callosobruchus maculatus]